MIKIPTKLRIYSPVMLANIDFTAEPELEGKTGSTYRGVAIADGGHAINAADGFPGRVLTVDKLPAVDTFNIEYAMTLIKKINSVILDGHNLLSVYAASLRDSFKIKHSATDVLGALVENEIRYSGLLGKERPFTRYDGLTGKTEIADSAQLDFGTGNGSFGGRFRAPDYSDDVNFITRFQNGGNQFILGWDKSENSLTGVLNVGGSSLHIALASWVPVPNRWYHIVFVFVNGVSNALYVDGLPLPIDGTNTTTGGDINIAGPLFLGFAGGAFHEYDAKEVFWENRAFAPKEVAQMALGSPVPKPHLLGLNSSIQLGNDWENNDFASFDNNGDLTLVADAAGQVCTLLNTQYEDLVTGKTYIISYDHVERIAGFEFVLSGSNQVIGTAVAGADQTLTFTVESPGDTGLRLKSTTNVSDGDFVNIYITDPDTLVTFPLVVDQWGKANVVANGELWTGATGGTPPTSWSDIAGGVFEIKDGSNISDAPPGADACLEITVSVAGSDPTVTQALTVENGQDYQMRVWGTRGKPVGATGNPAAAFRIRLGTTSGGSEIFDSGSLTDLTWVLTKHDFTTTGTTIYLTLTTVESTQVLSALFDFAVVDNPGAVAAYLDDGISADQAKWLDASSNNLHGVNTNVEAIDAPAGDVRGFVVSQFDEITNHKFWQMVFNEDLDTALLDILIGQVAGCWYRDYEIAAGGFKGRAGFPGVKLGMNESGRDNPELKFGEKPDWDLTLRVMDDESINDLEEFVRTVSGALLPVWISFDPPTTNNPTKEPVFERVTLVESVFPWEFKFGQTLPWQVGLKFSRRLD